MISPSIQRNGGEATLAVDSRMKQDKLMTLADAVTAFVHDGDKVAFGGMGGAQCVAHAYEIIRQKKRWHHRSCLSCQ